MNTKTKFNIIKGFALFLTVCFLLTAANAQTVSLQLQNDYTIGLSANQTPRFAVGDVNNDRLPDLVTLNSGLSPNQPISTFLNNGAGGFGSPLTLTDNTSLTPNAAVIRDFNGDGNQDLAIAAGGISNGVNIRLGNGTGNFPTGTYITAERGSPAIVSADFNGDGNFDIAVCNNVNELRVLNGNGAGAFGAAAVFPTTASCFDLITADFNVDGRPDLALTTTNTVRMFLNNGAGGFNTPVNTPVSGANVLVTADFNRDCVPDLAATQTGGGSLVFILLGNGAGGFTSASLTVTNSPERMSVGDFNRDKKVDLAIRRNVIQAGANNLTILPGDGAGGFGTAFELSIAPPTNTIFMRLATLDANLDGRDDLIVGRQGGFLLYHNSSALFTRTENDFDGDLRTDLSVFRPSNGTWYVNRSIGGFVSQQWGLGSDKPAAADYDGDGKTDFAVYREGAPSIAAFYILNSSTNTFRTEQFGQNGDDSSVVGDWDGDGKADPAVYRDSAIGNQSYFFYRGSLNNPNGAITFVPWGSAGDKPARGDFDGDGKADATIFRASNATWFIRQSSNGQGRSQTFGLSTDRRVPADYDGDGKTDIAVVRLPNYDWYILNSGSGATSYRQWGAGGDALIPGDYNGDGRTEISAYRGTEGGWYTPPCASYNQSVTRFGASGDIAVPSAFVP